LAQGSQWADRYDAPTKMWIPATVFVSAAGAPTLTTEPAGWWMPAWLLDSASIELVSTTFLLPTSWNTYDVYLWWANDGAGTGDVKLAVNQYTVTTTGSFYGTLAKTVTASAQNTLVHTKMNNTAISVVADMLMFNMRRDGDDAADTLGNDIAVCGLMLEKVS
jgi:hypothetical protein